MVCGPGVTSPDDSPHPDDGRAPAAVVTVVASSAAVAGAPRLALDEQLADPRPAASSPAIRRTETERVRTGSPYLTGLSGRRAGRWGRAIETPGEIGHQAHGVALV